MNNILVISHKNCNDGTAAAYALNEHFGRMIPRQHFFFLEHGHDHLTKLDEMGFFKDFEQITEIYILDFSLPIDVLETILKRSENVTITEIDHHKTFMERAGSPEETKQKLEELMTTYTSVAGTRYRYIFNNDCSGAVLTSLYFSGRYEDFLISQKQGLGDERLEHFVPRWLLYIQDRDIWKWKYEESAAYCETFFIEASDQENFIYRLIVEEFTVEWVKEGYVLLKQKEQQVEKLAESAHPCSFTLDGKTYKGMAINSNQPFTSDVCNLLVQTRGVDFALGYTFDKTIWKCGLRSLAPFDTTIISKHLGGGGHAQASGFKMKSFIELQDYFNF